MTSQDFHGHADEYDLYRRLVAERDREPAAPLVFADSTPAGAVKPTRTPPGTERNSKQPFTRA